jgi:hypothetical protein
VAALEAHCLDVEAGADIVGECGGRPCVRLQRAQELLAAGEVNGYAVWKCILVAAAELSRTKLAEGERVN